MNNNYYKHLLLKIRKKNIESLVANLSLFDITKENMLEYIQSLDYAKAVHKHIKENSIKQIPDSSIFELAILDATMDKIEYFDKKYEGKIT